MMPPPVNSNFPYILDCNRNNYIAITKDEFSFGRSLRADYTLENSVVSRIHFILKKIENGWICTDQSTNGTLVNDSLIKRTSISIKNEDIVKIVELSDRFKFICNEDVVELADRCEPLSLALQDHDYISKSVQNVKTQNETSNSRIVGCDVNVAGVIDQGLVTDEVLVNQISEVITDNKHLNSVNDEVEVKSDSATNSAGQSDKNKGGPIEMGAVEDELQCSICAELFIKTVTINCSHSFCRFCLSQWMKLQKVCPICRTHISSTNPTLTIDNFIEKIIESASEEVKSQRKEVIKEREQLEKKRKHEDKKKSNKNARGGVHAYIRCHICSRIGHYANQCYYR